MGGLRAEEGLDLVCSPKLPQSLCSEGTEGNQIEQGGYDNGPCGR